MINGATLKKKLKQLGVASVYLFGSRAKGIQHPQSDFDIGVLLSNPALLMKESTQNLYQDLYEILSDFYKTMVDIDIVFLQETTGQLRYHVVKEGKILFDIEPKIRRRFEDNTILEHADFEPYRKEFNQRLMTSIP